MSLVTLMLAVILRAELGCAQNCPGGERLPLPIPEGVGVSNLDTYNRGYCCGFTAGQTVIDNVNGNSYMLSAAHAMPHSGDTIIAPSMALPPNGCIAYWYNIPLFDKVAYVKRVWQLNFNPRVGNFMDASLAAIIPGRVQRNILNFGPVAPSMGRIWLGMPVKLMGGTSCVRHGHLLFIDTASGYVGPLPGQCGLPGFTLFSQWAFSAGFAVSGDSGALIVADGPCPRPIALVTAIGGFKTYGTPITTVYNNLAVHSAGGCFNPNAAAYGASAEEVAQANANAEQDPAAAALIGAEAQARESLAKHPEIAQMKGVTTVGPCYTEDEKGTLSAIKICVRVRSKNRVKSVRDQLPKTLDGYEVNVEGPEEHLTY